MSVSEELLNRYFQNKCTPEERLLVARYLEEIDEFPDHLFTREEWDNTPEANLDFAKTEASFEAVKLHTIAKKNDSIWLQIFAAAAMITIISIAGFMFSNQHQPGKQIAKTKKNSTRLPDQITWKSIVNYTEENQVVSLPDQSTVEIYPGGELRYSLPFIQHSREVFLQGKSFFKVAKDKKHPFIVYANGISTRALGTSFTVTASKESKVVKVALHTGKVWVKNIDTSHFKSFSKILMPGNELVYNQIDHAVKVKNTQLVTKQKEITGELTFNQVQMVTVLEKLEQHFKTKLNYKVKDLEEISFTGNINTKQSIDQILKELTELNELTLTKTKTGYLIQK